MKLTGEDLAALVLVGVTAIAIAAGAFYLALRFHGLDWKKPFKTT